MAGGAGFVALEIDIARFLQYVVVSDKVRALPAVTATER